MMIVWHELIHNGVVVDLALTPFSPPPLRIACMHIYIYICCMIVHAFFTRMRTSNI